MNTKTKNKDNVSLVTSIYHSNNTDTRLPVVFTQYHDFFKEQCKNVDLDENNNKKSDLSLAQGGYSGLAQRIEIYFDELMGFLESQENTGFIMQSIFEGDSSKLMRNGIDSIITEEFEGTKIDIISRKKKFLKYANNSIFTFDIDTPTNRIGRCADGFLVPYCADDVREMLIDTYPELEGVPMLISPSSTGFLSVDGEEITKARWHVMIPVKTVADAEYLNTIGFKRLFLDDKGWIQISKDGQCMVRTLIDQSIFKNVTQPIYTRPANILNDKIKRNAPERKYYPGNRYYEAGPALTTVQEKAYRAKVNEYKAETTDKAAIIEIEYCTSLLIKKGIVVSEKNIKSERGKLKKFRTSRLLKNDDYLFFKNLGQVIVSDVLKNRECYINEPVEDPLSIGSGEFKAKLIISKNNLLVLNSFAHGSTLFQFSSQMKKVSGRHAFIKRTKKMGSYQAKRLTKKHGIKIMDEKIKQVIDNKIPAYFGPESGFGKTKAYINYLVKIISNDPDFKCAIAVKDYNLMKDVSSRLKKALKKAKITDCVSTHEGMGRLCIRKEEFKHNEIGILGANLCLECKHGLGAPGRKNSWDLVNVNINCPYIKEYNSNKQSQITLITHSLLKNRSRFDSHEYDLVIVDEEALVGLINVEKNTASMTKSELPTEIKHIWEDVKDDQYNKIDDEYIKVLVEEKKLLVRRLSDNKGLYLYDAKALREIKRLSKLITFIEDYNDDLCKRFMIELKTDDDRIYYKLATGKRGTFAKFGRNIKHETEDKLIYEPANMMFFDASLNSNVVERILPGIEIIKSRIKYNPNVSVTQVSDKEFSKAQLREDPDVWKSIDLFLKGLKGRTLVICHKEFKEQVLAMQVNEEDFIYFGNFRGLDGYNDYDNVVQIGRHRLPSRAIAEMGVLLYDEAARVEYFEQQENQEGDFDLYRESKKMIIETSDGQDNVELYNSVMKDGLLRDLSEHTEHAENYQAPNRIRMIHGNKVKNVYILTKTVVDIKVDHVVTCAELLGGYKPNVDKKTMILNYINDNNFVDLKNNVMSKDINVKITDIENFKKKNGDWIKETFDVIDVKGRNTSRNTFKKSFAVKKDFKGDILVYIKAQDEKIKSIKLV